MSLDIYVFSRKREFLDWVARMSIKTTRSATDVILGYEPVSWSVKAAITDEPASLSWVTTRLRLPLDAKQAREVWNSIQEENLCLFFHLELDLGSVLVAARCGAWKSLNDRFLSFPKGDFSELLDDDAQKLVNDSKVWSGICGEVQMYGITCRVLQRRDTGVR